MSEHPKDSGGERDLTSEANKIKGTYAEKQETKVNISFTSLAEATLPNFSAMKILGNQIKVFYVPDFYHILELNQRLFVIAKKDKTIHKNEDINIYTFTLYITYGLLYVYIKKTQKVNPNSMIDYEKIIRIFETSGFNNFKVPSLNSQWISGLGEYTDTDIKRIFMPTIPDPVGNGDYFDNHFLSNDSGHLLPNIYAMMCAICNMIEPAINVGPPALRNRRATLGNDFAGNKAMNSCEQARRNGYRLPGFTALLTKVTDPNLAAVLQPAMARVYTDPFERYLIPDPALLVHLKLAMENLFLQIDSIVISDPTGTGTSLTQVPIVAQQNQPVLHAAVNIPAAPGPPPVIQIIIAAHHDHSFRIQTRSEIINGNLQYALQTPLVRVSNAEEAVIIGQHQYVDPQDLWYTQSIEFRTPIVTLEETRSYFHQK
jgi:hypothetical protein